MRTIRRLLKCYLLATLVVFAASCLIRYAALGYVFHPATPPGFPDGLESVDAVCAYHLSESPTIDAIFGGSPREPIAESRYSHLFGPLEQRGLLPTSWSTPAGVSPAQFSQIIRSAAGITDPPMRGDWLFVNGIFLVGRHRDGRQILIVESEDARYPRGMYCPTDQMMFSRKPGQENWALDWHQTYNVPCKMPEGLIAMKTVFGALQATMTALFCAVTFLIWLGRKWANWRRRERRGFEVVPTKAAPVNVDLRAHAPGNKCPECGTPVPAPPTSPRTTAPSDKSS